MRLAPVLLALLALAACDLVRPDGEPLLGAQRVSGEPNAVQVEFSGCEAEPEVGLRESSSTVRIVVSGPNGGCEPLHHLVVHLDAPLGDRTVVDGTTGDAVPVSDAAG